MSNWFIYQYFSRVTGRKIQKMLVGMTKSLRYEVARQLAITPELIDEIANLSDPFWASYFMSTNLGGKLKEAGVELHEYIHRTQGAVALFIDSDDLLQTLHRSKFSELPEIQLPPWRSFIVAPKKKTIINGFEIRPFLVEVAKRRQIQESMLEMARECPLEMYTIGEIGTDESIMVSITIDYGDYNHSIWRAEWDTFIERLRTNRASSSDDKSYINNSKMLVHARLAAALVVYTRIFKDLISEGLPDGIKSKEIEVSGAKILSGKLKCLKIGAPSVDSKGRAIHLRHGHWRFLWNKRYRRDEDNNIRRVWVKESTPGAKLTPYTAK